MAADFRARRWIEGETINYGQQTQDRYQNECHVEVRDAWRAARISIEQRRESQRDSAGGHACSHAQLGDHAGKTRGGAQMRFWNVSKGDRAEARKLHGAA